MAEGYRGPRMSKTAMLERNAKIVKLRDKHGLTLELIAQRFGLSQEGISTILRKAKGGKSGREERA